MYLWMRDTDQYRTVSWVPMVQFCTIQVYQCTSVTIPKKCMWYYTFTSCGAFHYQNFIVTHMCSLFNLLTSIICTHPAPTVQVSNVKVERVNNNRATLVSWTPLTLHQARGFPAYFVTYQPSLQLGRVVYTANTVSTNDSSMVIEDLDPTTEYIISVDVGTAGGQLRSTLAAGQSLLHQWLGWHRL